MSLPRQILPGRFYMITRRCTQRQFLLRPDEITNNTILYCLGEAAQRCGVEVILPSMMSNHHHTIVFDRDGHVVAFMEHFHKMVAKALNAHRGRWENLWSPEQVCLVHLVDRAAVIDKLVYAATNPVKDGLVERVAQWPGVNGLSALLSGGRLVATRPRQFFRASGVMPASVELDLAIPAELGDPEQVRRELREQVSAVEARCAKERRAEGRKVLGRRAVLTQAWHAGPTTHAPRRGLRPRIATRSLWSRLEALLRNRVFISEYTQARAGWLKGEPVLFPAGTYWLSRFAGVAVAAAA